MKRSGFTLLDLMICVAIIGVLCSIAIPAFNHYTNNSKKTEAKINLDLIGKGSLAFFNSEHAYDGGTKIFSRQYPSMNNPGRGKSDSYPPIGGMPYGEGVTQMSTRHDPTKYKTEFNSFPWKDLQFVIKSPFYFSYNYQGSDESNSGKVTIGAKSYFASTASACFNVNCVDKTTCDVGYVIAGGPNGTLTPILDNSDWSIESDCGKALLKHIKPGLMKKKIDLSKF